MRKLLLASLAALHFVITNAQLQTNESPFGLRFPLERGAEKSKIIAHDKPHFQTKVAQSGKHPQFAGFSIPVNISFREHANKVRLSADTVVWQLHLHIPEATELGIVFSEFELPENSKLFIYNETGQNHIGALTSKNNHYSGILSVRPIPATTLTVEYFAPGGSPETLPSIIIKEIIYITNSFAPDRKSGPARRTTDCMVSVNCPEGANWQKQKRGVARILLREGTSWFYCTGTLINNTIEDGRPLFLTADHCGEQSTEGDMLVWQFLFNYEYSSCSQLGSANNPGHVITGGELLASGPLSGGSDFRLLLLRDTPPPLWRPFYNGWSLSETNPHQGVGIHHPNGNSKKISTFTAPLFNATYPDGMVGGSWRVVWAKTESGQSVTEVGSSGSPLFNSEGLIVGTLSGGASSCAALNLQDYYGKFNRHWDSNGNFPNQQLQPWLDPAGTNPMTLYGYDPLLETNFVTLSVFPQNSGSATGGGFYAKGENVVLTSNPDTNFVFVNWTTSQNRVLSYNSVFKFTMPDSNLVITANFAPIVVDNGSIEVGKNIFITPNPATDNIFIRTEKPLDLIFYRIYSLTGKELMEGHFNDAIQGQTHNIDVNNLQSGLYILYIVIDEKVITHKLLIY